MKNMKQLLNNLIVEESGQDLIEYALIVGLLAFGCAACMSHLAASISTAFGNWGTFLTTVVS